MACRVRSGLGAEGRNRTGDTMIFSHVLYQLSYLGTRTYSSRASAPGPASAAAAEYSWGLATPPPGYNRRKEGPVPCRLC